MSTTSDKMTHGQELKALGAIAVPMAGAYLSEVALLMTAKIVVGRLGAVELAAAGLASDLAIEVLIFVFSVLSVVGVFVAHDLGAGITDKIGRHVRQGLWAGFLMGLPATVLMFFLADLLSLSDQDPQVLELTRGFFVAAALGVMPSILFMVFRNLLAALGLARVVTVVMVAGILLNIPLCQVLVHGWGDWAGLGVAGAGWSMSLVWWVMALVLGFHVHRSPKTKIYRVFSHTRGPNFATFGQFFKVGIPAGILTLIESGMFAAATVMAGTLGAEALAASQVGFSTIVLSFVIVLGIGEAATIRVAHAMGRGRMDEARRAGLLATGLGLCIVAAAAIGFLTIPRWFAAIYLDVDAPGNAQTMLIIPALLAVAALFQIGDAIQAVMARALRGMKDTTVPMWIAGFSYWLAGIGGGYLLAFPLGYETLGIWWGLALGLSLAGVMMSWRFFRLTRAKPR